MVALTMTFLYCADSSKCQSHLARRVSGMAPPLIGRPLSRHCHDIKIHRRPTLGGPERIPNDTLPRYGKVAQPRRDTETTCNLPDLLHNAVVDADHQMPTPCVPMTYRVAHVVHYHVVGAATCHRPQHTPHGDMRVPHRPQTVSRTRALRNARHGHGP